MTLLVISYSPAGDVLRAPQGSVTALAIQYDPPLRAARYAPPNLRAPSLSFAEAEALANFLQREDAR